MDLVERLRKEAVFRNCDLAITDALLTEAADALEALLRAVEPFARAIEDAENSSVIGAEIALSRMQRAVKRTDFRALALAAQAAAGEVS